MLYAGCSVCCSLLAGIALGAAAAQAHPHVWITAKSELIYAADGIDHRRAPRLDL